MAELVGIFKKEKKKNLAGLARDFITNLDSKWVEEEKLIPFAKSYQQYVEDKNDLPHICAYFAASAEYFRH